MASAAVFDHALDAMFGGLLASDEVQQFAGNMGHAHGVRLKEANSKRLGLESLIAHSASRKQQIRQELGSAGKWSDSLLLSKTPAKPEKENCAPSCDLSELFVV